LPFFAKARDSAERRHFQIKAGQFDN
jgi:hypothetical protein